MRQNRNDKGRKSDREHKRFEYRQRHHPLSRKACTRLVAASAYRECADHPKEPILLSSHYTIRCGIAFNLKKVRKKGRDRKLLIYLGIHLLCGTIKMRKF